MSLEKKIESIKVKKQEDIKKYPVANSKELVYRGEKHKDYKPVKKSVYKIIYV